MAGRMFDVIVVGGGVIGCGIAYELTMLGQRVAVIERGKIGSEASWASAGIISVPNKQNMAPERVEITRRGHELYPELIQTLEAETGYAI
jgi:glycine oxidase